MFECTIIRKSLQSTLPDVPKKKLNKENEENEKKDLNVFQKPENVVNVIFGGDPNVPKSCYYGRSFQSSLQFRDP